MNRCKVCGGVLADEKIKHSAPWRDRNIGIQNISASVCQTCGQAYITRSMANNLKYLERPMYREEFLKNPEAFNNTKDFNHSESNNPETFIHPEAFKKPETYPSGDGDWI